VQACPLFGGLQFLCASDDVGAAAQYARLRPAYKCMLHPSTRALIEVNMNMNFVLPTYGMQGNGDKLATRLFHPFKRNTKP